LHRFRCVRIVRLNLQIINNAKNRLFFLPLKMAGRTLEKRKTRFFVPASGFLDELISPC
jgi:hypothetical protein